MPLPSSIRPTSVPHLPPGASALPPRPLSPIPLHRPSLPRCRWQNTYQVWSEVIDRKEKNGKKMTGLLAAGTTHSVLLRLKREPPTPLHPPPHTHTSCGHLDPSPCLSPSATIKSRWSTSGHPASTVGVRTISISSAYSPWWEASALACVLDLFLAPAVMDFPFSCFVWWWRTVERSLTSRLLHLLSLAVSHRLLGAILWFFSCRQAVLLHDMGAHLSLISHCSDNTEKGRGGGGVLYSNQTMWTPPNPFNSLTFCPFFSPPSALSSSFFAYSLSAGKLSSQSPCGRRVGCGRGEVAGIMTEAGWRGAENKVALIRICQEQCAHKAAWESNLVLAVSLSDISAISRHRSECETSTLSDFLKSHQWKHKRMSVLEVKKKKKAFRPHKWTASLYTPANKCQPSLASFVLLMSAAHSGFKWIFLLYISLQGWLWAVLVLLEPLCNSIVLNVAFGCTTKNGSMLGGETVGMSLVFLTRAIRH